jgi:cyclase
MRTKRIIPCLDVKDGRTVKGVNFVGLRDAGDIVELASRYRAEGADELVMLDITASTDRRATMPLWVERVAAAIDIPFTVGGGIASEQDVETVLGRGADKVSINSAALDDPSLLDRLSRRFGSGRIILAIDARLEDGVWRVYSRGGMERTPRELVEWAAEGQSRGVGEILFTSMDHDGTKFGYPLEALSRLSQSVGVPVIASGGAGGMQDFYDALTIGGADAALAAGIFHFGEVEIPKLKQFLRERGVEVR